MRRSVSLLLLSLLLSAAGRCTAADPPTPKRMIAALLANGDIPLTVDASCKGVGSESKDANLRDYVSGLLENFTDASARNSIAVKVVPVKLPNGERRWQCQIEFVHVPGEDPFRYGVSFQMKSDGTLVRKSVRCIGVG
jgi:hypothetical protein